MKKKQQQSRVTTNTTKEHAQKTTAKNQLPGYVHQLKEMLDSNARITSEEYNMLVTSFTEVASIFTYTDMHKDPLYKQFEALRNDLNSKEIIQNNTTIENQRDEQNNEKDQEIKEKIGGAENEIVIKHHEIIKEQDEKKIAKPSKNEKKRQNKAKKVELEKQEKKNVVGGSTLENHPDSVDEIDRDTGGYEPTIAEDEKFNDGDNEFYKGIRGLTYKVVEAQQQKLTFEDFEFYKSKIIKTIEETSNEPSISDIARQDIKQTLGDLLTSLELIQQKGVNAKENNKKYQNTKKSDLDRGLQQIIPKGYDELPKEALTNEKLYQFHSELYETVGIEQRAKYINSLPVEARQELENLYYDLDKLPPYALRYPFISNDIKKDKAYVDKLSNYIFSNKEKYQNREGLLPPAFIDATEKKYEVTKEREKGHPNEEDGLNRLFEKDHLVAWMKKGTHGKKMDADTNKTLGQRDAYVVRQLTEGGKMGWGRSYNRFKKDGTHGYEHDRTSLSPTYKLLSKSVIPK
jgi:hypothetical protein